MPAFPEGFLAKNGKPKKESKKSRETSKEANGEDDGEGDGEGDDQDEDGGELDLTKCKAKEGVSNAQMQTALAAILNANGPGI